MGHRFGKLAALLGAGGLVLAACSSGSNNATANSGTSTSSSGGSGTTAALTVATFNPFSGSDASFGPTMKDGCDVAAMYINKAGGVLGHNINCTAVDTRGDPADAVPAANKMVATTSHLAMVIGPSSATAASTVPILNQAKVPMFADAGLAEFDQSKFNYFWRLVPPDAADGFAMSMEAQKLHYTRVALIYGSNVGATNAPAGVIAGVPALTMHLVYKAQITADQSSYESTVTSMLATHPQAILFEAGPRTSATFFSNLKSLGGLLPVIGPEAIYETAWTSAVSAVIGTSQLAKEVTIVEAYVDTTAPGNKVWTQGLSETKATKKTAKSQASDPFAIAMYDGTNLDALAMLEKKTTTRTVVNNAMLAIANGTTGAVTCDSFATCKKVPIQVFPAARAGSREAVGRRW